MPILIAALVALIALAGFLFKPPKPAVRNLNFVGAVFTAVQSLYKLGMEGGEIRFQVKGDETQCVTLTKHILGQQNFELIGVLSGQSLAPERYNAVREKLADKNIHFSDTVANGKPQLQVRFGSNLNDADFFVTTAIEIGFGVDVATDCVAYLTKILFWNIPAVTGTPNK